ncbi:MULTISPECIES: hypothetical protein [unclassified Chryseobacterium]|uniref:hypothetical protein n=1 Tax=unclassified Chryseobacterium TaxID=2593645 RepID=UPI00100AFD2E|nr:MULTISPECIES: hypothetical protein [unclassified Chryseobacterium]
MRNFILIIIFLLSCKISSQNKEGNIIITVDQNVHPSLSNMYILKGEKKYYISYFPGKFVIKEEDYKDLLHTDNSSSLKLVMNNNLQCKDNLTSKMYEIEDFKLSWLDQPYVILYIYNTDNKDYKNIYNPLPGKSYTYDYEYPGGTMKRIQKIFTKAQNKCQRNE